MQPPILILGMHRSGTSVLSNILQAMGVDFGQDLIAPSRANPLGYFEDKHFLQIHEAILAAAGQSWRSLLPIAAEFFNSSELAAFANIIYQRCQEKFSSSVCYAVKDPRLARLLPVWEKAFCKRTTPLRLIIVLRHPLEVCHSLKQRDDFAIMQGMLLYCRYLLDASFYSKAHPHLFIAHHDIYQQPRKVVAAIHKFLQEEHLKHETVGLSSLIKPELRHFKHQQLNEDVCNPLALRLFENFSGDHTSDGELFNSFAKTFLANENHLNLTIAELKHQLEKQHDSLFFQIQQLKQSSSWKITAPLRFLSRKLSLRHHL